MIEVRRHPQRQAASASRASTSLASVSQRHDPGRQKCSYSSAKQPSRSVDVIENRPHDVRQRRPRVPRWCARSGGAVAGLFVLKRLAEATADVVQAYNGCRSDGRHRDRPAAPRDRITRVPTASKKTARTVVAQQRAGHRPRFLPKKRSGRHSPPPNADTTSGDLFAAGTHSWPGTAAARRTSTTSTA